MDLSLGLYAVIIIFFYIIIPGFIARRFYFHGEFSKQINATLGTPLNLIYSFFYGFLLIIGIVIFLDYVVGIRINIDAFLNNFDTNFIAENDKGSGNTARFTGFSKNLYTVYLPFIGAFYCISATFGLLISKSILVLGLDAKTKFFRFGNNWHYLFSGKILKFKPHLNEDLKVKHTYLDVLVSEKSEETTLYSGFFADYDLCPNDISKLERLYLLRAKRYKKVDGVMTTRDIPGDVFTIVGDKILNINCTYDCYNESEEKQQAFTKRRKILFITQIFTTIFFLTMFICVIFKLNIFNKDWFNDYVLERPLLEKTTLILLLNISIGLITPFKIDYENQVINFLGWKAYLQKIALIISIFFLLILFSIRWNDAFWYIIS